MRISILKAQAINLYIYFLFYHKIYFQKRLKDLLVPRILKLNYCINKFLMCFTFSHFYNSKQKTEVSYFAPLFNF